MPRKCPYSIELSSAERVRLEAIARKYTSPYRDVIRAKIVLYAAAGLDTERAIAQVRTNEHYKAQMRSSCAHLMDFLSQSGLLTKPAMSIYKRVNML
jgi:hypothetical protein